MKKFYHSFPRISNTGIGIISPSSNEQSICSLVQKTIIPLNIVTPKPSILDMPCTISMGKLDYSLPKKIDVEPEKLIIDPNRHEEKLAHRLLIIRRRKMNKHKHHKYKRKHKFEIAKRRRQRKMKTEVRFRLKIAGELKDVEKFNAEAYVAEKLEIYRKEILPLRLHGKIMPAFVLEEYMERRKLRKKYSQEVKDRRQRFKEKRGGTLDVDIKS